jgi:predicted transposase YdaD
MPALRHHISRITNPQLTATVMTIAEQLITQGLQEGRQEGLHTAKRDALLLILRKRFGSISDQQRAHIDGADLYQLQLWTEAALDAASIDAVFAER